MRKFFWIIACMIGTAQAFVTPPSFFFQQWVNQNKSFQNILIKQERQTFLQGGVPLTTAETVKIKRPGLYKITTVVNGSEEIRLVGKTKAMLGTSPSLRQVKLQDVITPLEASIMYAQSGTMESILNQIQVDAKQSALELFRHEPLIRVGDKNGNRIYISSATNMMQAAVYKNLTYMFTYDANSTLPSYPSVMEIYDGETLKEKIKVVSVSTTAKISESEFEAK